MSLGDERLARSVALENAYVHDVYEQFYDNPQSKPWPKVKSFLDSLEPGSIVCDIGCGNGKYLSLNNTIFNIGGDKSLRLTSVAREKDNEVIILDNLSLPFRDDSLDAVLSIAVVHHLATTERRINAIRELARVLRIGGRIIISVWAMEQSHRKFESQDVLVPWRRPKNLLNTPSFELTSATSTSEDDSYLPYNAYTQTSDTESNKSLRSRITLKRRNRRQKNMNPGRNLSQSSSSLSSPNETCYSFVRRALQRLAGGRRVSMHKPWFLESWTTCHKESSSKRFDPGGIQPCECCDCMDNVQDIPIELRRIDDETVAIGQRRKTFPSSQLMSDLPQAGFKSRSLTNIKTAENNDTVVSLPSEEDDNKEMKESHNEKEKEIATPEIQTDGTSRHLGKPKLVKQKKSVCEEDADEALDQPTDMANISRTPSSMFKTLHLTNRRSSILKQRSLNEELMSDRVQEKERVRRNIQKQVSLNEELIYQRHTFESFKDSLLSVSTSKRFQLIKTGFTNKFKNSTNNIEKVTGQSLRNGFARMFQNWKSSEGSSPLTPKDILETKISSTNEDVQQKEPIERRSSKEDGSDSSKDSSLQSDTSVDSEDSFASVIFVPKSNPMSPTPLPSDPTSPKVRTSSMPTSPKLKQSSCPTSPRIKQMPLTVYPLTKQLSSPKPTTKQEFLEMPSFGDRDTLTVKKPPERCKPLANKYTVVPIPEFKRIVQPCPNPLPNTSPNQIPKCQVNPPKQKSVEEEKATETRAERLKRIREMLSQSPGFALKANKANFPLIRHSSAADGKVSAEPLPKLISLELFNPETDDKDSDSSAISSPDSVDSIVSVKSDQKRPVEEESRFKFPTYKNTKQNKLLEAAAGVASSLDEAVTKVIKTSPKFSKRQVRATDVMSVIKRSYSFETTPLVPKENSPNHWKEDSNIHLKDFAEKLSEKLLKEIDEYQKKTKRHLDNTSLENINDPYIHRLSTELDDLSKLSAEIKKQNEYLAKLSASEISFNRCAVCKKYDCKCRYNRKSRTKVEKSAKDDKDTVVDDKTKNTGDIVKLDSSRSNSTNEFLEKDRCTPDKTSTSSESDNVLRFNSKNFVRLGNSTDSCDSEKGSSTTSMVSMISSTATSFNLLSESSIDSMSSERTNTDFLERGELSSSGRGSNEGSTASLVSVPEAAPARNGSFKNPLKRSECITSSTSSLESSSRKAPNNIKGKNLSNSTFSGTTSQESLVSENMGARKQKLEDILDTSPGLNRLASHQPSIPTENDFDPTKRILPFGRSGIPILRRDLQQPDVLMVLRTLSTMNDLLKNPEKAYEAIRLRVQDRLITVIPREEQFVRERCCLSYLLLSVYADGKRAMVANPDIVKLFLQLIKDEKTEVRLKAAQCLERISSFWMTADGLVEAGFIKPLMDRIGVDDPEVSAVHLYTLANLMYGNGKYIGMEAGAFDLMVSLLDSLDLDVRKGALRCLMLMTSTDLGKQMAAKCNLLVILARILHEDESLYVDAASVLIYCTMLVQAKAASAKMKMIPTRLVRLCKNHLNPDLQLFCLKALTNISEHPDVRLLMKKKHLGRLKRISVSSDLLRKHKNILLRVVTWDPSDLVCTFGNQD